MIDTLKVRLNDYTLESNNAFQFVGSIYNSSGEVLNETLLTKIGEREIYGTKGYFNTDFYNCTLDKNVSSDADCQSNMIVQFSLPRLYSKSHNLISLDYEQTKETINNLSCSLNDSGIKTNLLDAEIIRLDTFKNIETDKTFPYYKDIFSLMNLTKGKETDYGSTMLWKNSNSQICIYDKIQEMKDKFKTKYSLYIPAENIIRFENRIMNKRKVLQQLQYADVKSLISKDGYSHCIDNYYTNMKSKVFRRDIVDTGFFYDTNELEHELQLFKDNYGRYYFEKWLMYKTVSNINKFINFESLMEIVKKIELSNGSSNGTFRVKKNKWRKIFNELNEIKVLLGTDKTKDFTTLKLYKELKSKMFDYKKVI